MPKLSNLLLAVALVFAAVGATAQDSGWYQIKDKDKGFQIDMPGQPTLEQKPLEDGGVSFPCSVYTFGAHNWGFVAIATTHSPAEAHTLQAEYAGGHGSHMAQHLFDSVATKFVTAHTDVSKAFGKFRGQPTMTLMGRGHGIAVRWTVVISVNHSYILESLTPNGEEDGVEARRFLTSFKILKGS